MLLCCAWRGERWRKASLRNGPRHYFCHEYLTAFDKGFLQFLLRNLRGLTRVWRRLLLGLCSSRHAHTKNDEVRQDSVHWFSPSRMRVDSLQCQYQRVRPHEGYHTYCSVVSNLFGKNGR